MGKVQMEFLIIKQMAIALIIGMMIGLQREVHYQKKKEISFAGTRTFALIALLGYLSAWIQSFSPLFLVVSLAIFGLIVLVSYIIKTTQGAYHGATTEIAALITFILGVMLFFSLDAYAISLAIVMLFLLEIKGDISRIEEHITTQDLSSMTLFLMMSFVLLPLLPDRMVDPFGIFNPYKTWLMVVLIAGISFIGYVAIKILGNKRGVYLTGIFGGLVSSTAVSITLSKLYSIQKTFLKNFAGGIAIASTIMYLRVLLETSFFNLSLTKALAIPYLGASIVGLVFVFYLYKHERVHKAVQIEVNKNPLALSEALKLGLLFGLIFGSIGIFQSKFGDSGVYVISFLSGFTDVDAITLSLSQLARHKISQEAAMNGIIIASIVNSLVKLGIVFVLGGKKLGLLMALFYMLSIGVLLGAMLL
jgi:uncharacterized membrane protein (DUF4010 family)